MTRKQQITATGQAGNLEWTLSNGVLTISGNGEIPDYDAYLNDDMVGCNTDEGRSPWYPYRKKIKKIVFKGNISKKGVYNFVGCNNLSSVTFENCTIPVSSYVSHNVKDIIDRALQGYTHVDIWNIDCWFIQQISRMLSEFKRKSRGCIPAGMSQDEWDAILDRMIFCFLEAEKTYEFPMRRNEYTKEMLKEGLELFCKYYGHLWW